MRMRTSAAAVAAAATLVALGAATGPASAAPYSPPSPAALPVAGPLAVQPVPAGAGRLYDVERIDSHVTFAGGRTQQSVGKGSSTAPLVLRKDDRDGKGWQAMALPALPDGDHGNEVNDVAAVPGTAGEAWAVGLESSPAGCAMPGADPCGPVLADHWDGTSWRSLPVPMPADAEFGGLSQVSAAGPGDVWAVGWAQILDSAAPTPGKPGGWTVEDHMEALVVHWDGRAWSRVDVPGAADFLPTSIAVRGPRDVWTAGWDSQDTPVVQHWNGRAWTTERLPATGLAGEVYGLGFDAAGTPWAVGRTVLTDEDAGHALVLRKVGGSWRKVPVPAGAGPLDGLASTPGGIAVEGNTQGARDGYAMRLDAAGWHQVALPAANGLVSLAGVTYGPGQGLTLVGDLEPDGDPFSDATTPLVVSAG